jgi:hypothetical protein
MWAPLRMTPSLDKDLSMNPSPSIVSPVVPSATVDTGRIRLGGGWRLPTAAPAAR